MPRPRTFDVEEALDAAMRVFWARGFAETSYDNLVEQTGVSRKGLYTVFGDKKCLHLATLKHYRKTVVLEMRESLEKPDLTLDDIRHFFRFLAEIAADGRGAMGCYMANTAADSKVIDSEVKRELNAHLNELKNWLMNALATAGISPKRCPELSVYFVGVMQGIFLLAHAQAEAEMIYPFVEESLKALE